MENEHDQKDIVNADELIRQRTIYGVRPKKASQSVSQLMARRGIGQEQFNDELRSKWNQAVGAKWNQLSMAGNINRGVLEIVVANSMVNQQLAFEKKKLVSTMQKLMPNLKLKDLRFRVGKIT